MTNLPLPADEVAVRAHDVAVCLERTTVPEFDFLTTLGMATRLALHLRGVPAVSYEMVRNVAVQLLDFPTPVVTPVLQLLAEAEFVRLDMTGRTIMTVIPNVPYYDNMFAVLGEVASAGRFSEPEAFTLDLLHRLAASPLVADSVYQMGAEKKLINRVIDIGTEGSFLVTMRARGRDVILSPTYFPESGNAYADLVAAGGAARVRKVLNLLRTNPGWPLAKLLNDRELADTKLDDADIALVQMLAGEGFLPPPAIETRHAGLNHFLFGPRPHATRLPPAKRPVYEAAMALVAAVRQGQLLPARIAIRSPLALLCSLRDRGYLKASTEALEQYRQVAALHIGRLETTSDGWARLVLTDLPESHEAVDMAIDMVSGVEPVPSPADDVILAMRQGDKYVESLIGRKRLQGRALQVDPESLEAIEAFLLRGRE